jgi:hypothetical protein
MIIIYLFQNPGPKNSSQSTTGEGDIVNGAAAAAVPDDDA